MTPLPAHSIHEPSQGRDRSLPRRVLRVQLTKEPAQDIRSVAGTTVKMQLHGTLVRERASSQGPDLPSRDAVLDEIQGVQEGLKGTPERVPPGAFELHPSVAVPRPSCREGGRESVGRR